MDRNVVAISDDRQWLVVKPGERARSRRSQLGMSLREVAERANVTFSMLSDWERGKKDMTLSRAVDVAKVLGVRLDWLVRNEVAVSEDQRALAIMDGGRWFVYTFGFLLCHDAGDDTGQDAQEVLREWMEGRE